MGAKVSRGADSLHRSFILTLGISGFVYPLRKQISQLLLFVIIIFSLCLLLGSCSKGERSQSGGENTATAAEETTPAILVETTQPVIQRVEHHIRSVGSFLPDDQVTISPEIEGKVKKILVDEGYIIKEGQLLVQLEDRRQRLAAAEAEAKIRENEINLAYLSTTLNRREELWKKNILSKQAYDEILSQVNLAKARADSLLAALGRARKDLEDTKIYSPLDAIITEKIISEGEYVDAGDALLKAVKINPLKLHFTLPENQAGLVTEGQLVKARVKAHPDEEFSGKVYFINSQIDPSTRAVQVKAYFDNPEGRLKPGFFADVFLVREVNEKALLIPGEGVVQREDKYLVYVMNNGVAHERAVEIGERLEGKIEILSGLNPQDLIITSGNHNLEDGSRVKVLNHSSR